MSQCLVFMNTGQIEAIAVTGRAHCRRQVAFFKDFLTASLRNVVGSTQKEPLLAT